MVRGSMAVAVAICAAMVAWPSGAVAADPEIEGWWSGTIEVSSEADRTYKIRYDTEPESNDRVQGSSSHSLEYRLELEPTLGWSNSFRLTVPYEDFDAGVMATNARFTYFNWIAGGTAQLDDSCLFTASGSLSGPISSPIAYEGFDNVVAPRWGHGPVGPRGLLSLSPLGSCDFRPIFGIANFSFRTPDPFDEVLFRWGPDDSQDLVRHLNLCADRFDSISEATPATDLITTVDGRPVIDASGTQRCDGTYYYDFGDSIVTQEDVAALHYDIDVSFTPKELPPGDPGPFPPGEDSDSDSEPDAGEDRPKRPHLGLVCGKAEFDFHSLNAETDLDFVHDGEKACMVAISNALTRELGKGALLTTKAILERFGHLFIAALGNEAVDAIVETTAKSVKNSILKSIVPELRKASGRVNPIVNAGKAIALGIVPYAAATHLKHLRNHKGCTRLLLDVDDGKLRMAGGLLYSPSGLEDPRADGELTEASVWRQTERRLARDDWDRMSSGLSCTTKGQIGLSGEDNEIFSGAKYFLLKG